MPFTVEQLAGLVAGAAEGDLAKLITGANSLADAAETDLSFAANQKALAALAASRAGCVVVPLAFAGNAAKTIIRAANPRAAFAKALHSLYPSKQSGPPIHPTAVIAPGARIGANCLIGAGCVLGSDVTLGENSVLHPRVTIYDGVTIGARAIIHSGCVIGADGFGFVLAGDRYEKFPQVGRVEIGNDVELGANCCIDRAALGVTRIGDGTKLDNLVHVAHNCQIGNHVLIAAQTGFSGSVTVGDYAMIGGQAGIGEKANIAAKAVVGGKAGVLTGQTVSASEPVWGIPARPLRGHLKSLACFQKLPELNKTVIELKQRVLELETAEMP